MVEKDKESCIIVIALSTHGGDIMTVSYKKLWKKLIDLEWKKKDLEKKARISHYTMNKLNKGENITTDILGRICKALDCSADDIMEFIFDETDDKVVAETNNKSGGI